MILFSRRYSREMEAVLVPAPAPHLLVENERVYEPGAFGLCQFCIVEASDYERAALEDSGFQIGTPKECSASGKPALPLVCPQDLPMDDDPL